MDRRNFVKTGLAALAAAELGSVDLIAKNPEKKEVRISGTDWSCEHIAPGPGDLKMRFLGTGAAGWKSPTSGHRRMSSVLLDDKILIDFTLSAQDMVPKGIHPKIIFYTHSHRDHFQPVEALKVGVRKVYLNESILALAQTTFAEASMETGIPVPELIPFNYGQQVTEEGIRFTALPANHATGDIEELTNIYLLEKDFGADGVARVRVIYATDTAGIMGRAARMAQIDRHKAGIGVTGLVMESTMGMARDEDFRIFNHSSAKLVQRTTNVMLETERLILPEGQPVYLTHMSRSLNPTQEELDKTLPWPLRAAYDGLEVVFR